MRQIVFSGLFFLTLFFAACGNLENEINLDLPEYQSQLVVECYLEPGQPFTLALSRSVPYFDPFPDTLLDFVDQILVDSATITISHNGTDYPMTNLLLLNPTTKKAFNYFNVELVPTDFDHDFSLKIVTKDGKTITAATRLLPVVPIDSIVVEFNEDVDTIARVLTYITDDPATDDYYRRMIHLNSLDSIPQQDFTTFDDYVDDKKIVFGTPYDFEENDTIWNTIYHIDRAYFDFWESTFNAINANGNPFGQPSAIISNVKGDGNPIGIFTGLSYDRVMTIIKK